MARTTSRSKTTTNSTRSIATGVRAKNSARTRSKVRANDGAVPIRVKNVAARLARPALQVAKPAVRVVKPTRAVVKPAAPVAVKTPRPAPSKAVRLAPASVLPARPVATTMEKPKPFVVSKPAQLIFLKPEAALQHADIKPGQTVADLGAGSGYITIPAAIRTGSQGLVYAVDILKDELAGIRSQAKLFGLPNVVTVWADLEVPRATGIADNSCDVVFIFKVLCQQKRRDVILEEARRIAKPGANIMVAEWCEQRLGFGEGAQKIISKPELMTIAEKVGLEQVKEYKLDDFHYILKLRKSA